MIHKKNVISIMVALCAIFFIAIPASAHVTVKPANSTTDAWETYQIRIPIEKDIPTTKVALKIPETVEFKMYEPELGWTTTTTTDDNGKVTTVIWEASSTEAAIQPGQYKIFSFTAKNPSEADNVAWDAFQYYEDGSIVEWAGEEGSDHPHSITEIIQGDTTTDGHGQVISHEHDTDDEGIDEQVADNETNEANEKHSDSESSATLPITLSIIAIVVSSVAIVLSFIRKK